MSVSRQHLCISTDENGTLTIKDTSTYGTVVSYERLEHQGDFGGWGSLRHYAPPNVPPSSQERRLTPERNELDDFSERIQFLAQPLGTDIDGNRFVRRQFSGIIEGRDKVSIKSFIIPLTGLKLWQVLI